MFLDVHRDDVSNRKRPSSQDFTHVNQIKIQKKSEGPENENVEETITGTFNSRLNTLLKNLSVSDWAH